MCGACHLSPFSELYLADVVCALFNAMLMCCVMLPLSVYSGKILLQVCVCVCVRVCMWVWVRICVRRVESALAIDKICCV